MYYVKGRTGLNLREVGDAEWDGNVGARILDKLVNWMDSSQQR